MIENRVNHMNPEALGVDTPMTAQESLVTAVYASVDQATSCELARLHREESLTESCGLDCCHCCRFHILITAAEAHTLGQYIRREFSEDQIDSLRTRTQQWHEWDEARPGRSLTPPRDRQTDLSDYDPCCPLLMDGVCIAYPVRPVVCRTHFVCSDPRFCRAAIDPDSTEDAPVALRSVVRATEPFSKAIGDQAERTGLDSSRSLMLLPHSLAIEMGWDFALTP